jgi:hypothetical protein
MKKGFVGTVIVNVVPPLTVALLKERHAGFNVVPEVGSGL